VSDGLSFADVHLRHFAGHLRFHRGLRHGSERPGELDRVHEALQLDRRDVRRRELEHDLVVGLLGLGLACLRDAPAHDGTGDHDHGNAGEHRLGKQFLLEMHGGLPAA
jgi:hypothetical protein